MTDFVANRASKLENFFDETIAGFTCASEQLGGSTHDFRIAERHVRVRLAGDSLRHLIRPLAHLKKSSRISSSCLVHCKSHMKSHCKSPCLPKSHIVTETEWPTAATALEIFALRDSPDGWLPPRPPWDFAQLGHGGAIAGLEDDRVLVNFTADHGLLCMYHRPTHRAVYWLPSADQLPYWELAAPFRILLHWWSQSFGGQIVHAAAVGCDGQGVLLAGRGGSGKSTTSIACVDVGMQYVGDDYVLLLPGKSPTAHSLYHSGKIHTAFLGRALPHWQSRVAAEIGPEHKSLLFLHECEPDRVRDRLTISAILQPKVGAGSRAQIVPQSASLGLLAIAPSTMYQLPRARQSTLSIIAESIRELPSYRLNLGTDVHSAPRGLIALLARREASYAA